MSYIIYTDGSSTGKQGKAGAAAIIFSSDILVSGLIIAEPITYECGNNVAELYAILLAVKDLPYKASAKIITDSKNCIMWLAGNWQRRDEKIKLVADEIDLIWQKKDLMLTFQWVKGHSKILCNEAADWAANQAKQGRTIRYEGKISEYRKI